MVLCHVTLLLVVIHVQISKQGRGGDINWLYEVQP